MGCLTSCLGLVSESLLQAKFPTLFGRAGGKAFNRAGGVHRTLIDLCSDEEAVSLNLRRTRSSIFR